MEIWKRITKYGNSLCVAMTKELKSAGYDEGDYIKIIIEKKDN